MGFQNRDLEAIYDKLNTGAALGPSESHIGQVGGTTVVVSNPVTMSVAGSYASGDYMGVSGYPSYFNDALRVSLGSGILKSLTIIDKILTANVAMELWLFSDTFTPPTDNAPFTITDVEALNVLGVIPIATTGWYATGANQIYHDSTLAIPLKSSDSTIIYYALVARGTTPTFASLDLTIKLGILQD